MDLPTCSFFLFNRNRNPPHHFELQNRVGGPLSINLMMTFLACLGTFMPAVSLGMWVCLGGGPELSLDDGAWGPGALEGMLACAYKVHQWIISTG